MAIMDNTKLLEEVASELPMIQEKIKEPLIIEPFFKDFRYRFCWNSNAIEGNTLSLDETVSVIDYDEVKSGHTYSEYAQAKNLYQAILQKLSLNPTALTEQWIKDANSIIMNTSGSYRQRNLYVGTLVEATYYPPDYQQVPEQMKRFIESLDIVMDDCIEIIKNIAKQHIVFERIHPFSDGNGRTGRMILNQQLINHGLLPIIIENQSKYRQAFRVYDKNADTSLLIYLLCKGELSAIKTVKGLLQKMKKELPK